MSDAPLVALHEVGHVYRRLRGNVRALDGCSLEMHAGEVVGLAGPNGAGKSTLIALLLGFLQPTEGVVLLGGVAPRQYIEQHGIGYLSELVYIQPRWRLEVALRRFAALAGVPARDEDARVEEVIATLGLGEHRGKTVKQLSKGNLQRLGLAQALLADETLLVLDEPTHGLDPVWTQRFRDLVTSLRRPDRLIFVASHNLDELQRIADRVAIIDGGRLQRVVDMRAERTRGAVPYRLVAVTHPELVREQFPGATVGAGGEFLLPALDLSALNAGAAALIARGALIAELAPVHSALEQQFREAVHQ